MKILGSMFGLGISTKGMSIQRKKMDLISQNIANSDNMRTENGEPYRRKFIAVRENQNSFAKNLNIEGTLLNLNRSEEGHLSSFSIPDSSGPQIGSLGSQVTIEEKEDLKPGEMMYMPDHPEADENGYVQMSNVNVITEMVDMIAATRSYEANLTAMNSTKQMIKDSLEI